MFKPNWGRVLLYAGLVAVAYAVELQTGLKGLSWGAAVWAVFMVSGDVLESSGRVDEGMLLRVVGVSLGVLPVEAVRARLQLSLLFLGAGTAFLAPRLGRLQRLTRGIGLFLALYALSRIEMLKPVGSVFLYAGVALLLGYAGAELGQRGHVWAEILERNLIGVGILGGILGLYASVRGNLSESHPELVFYGEWLVLVLGVLFAGSMVYSYVAGRDPESYLLAQWRRHEAKAVEKFDPELIRARKAIEDFVVRGRKGPLLAFISYYGARLFENRGEFERLVSLIADYEGKRTSVLTPLWIRRHYERRELERRIQIVEEVFGKLTELMG